MTGQRGKKRLKKLVEKITLGKEEYERRQRVRRRISYKHWKDWYKFLKTKPSIEMILREIYQELDIRRSFGSALNARYSLESLELLLEDEKSEENES